MSNVNPTKKIILGTCQNRLNNLLLCDNHLKEKFNTQFIVLLFILQEIPNQFEITKYVDS